MNALCRRLRAARTWQSGGAPMDYVDMRILEKKRLIMVYRRPDGQPYTVILTHRGREHERAMQEVRGEAV